MVSMVGPGRTYHGFLEKTRPTMVFTYQGWVGPTMVFSARRRRKILRFLIQKHMDSLHRNAFPNRGITKKSACGGSFPLPIIVYISPWKSKYQIQEQNHGSQCFFFVLAEGTEKFSPFGRKYPQIFFRPSGENQTKNY